MNQIYDIKPWQQHYFALDIALHTKPGLKKRCSQTREARTLFEELTSMEPTVFNSDLASSLNKVSIRLSKFGQREEALAPIQQAVDLRRAFAAERPEVFNADFASSLHSLSIQLSELGRYEEALAPIQQAVDLDRALAAKRPQMYNGNLHCH